MANSNFEAKWVPRIGEKGAAELRRLQHTWLAAWLTGMTSAVAASFAFAGGPLAKLLGVALVAGAVGALVAFVRGQKRFAAVLSEWFGVRITAGTLPPMNRFDTWCEWNGLHGPAERSDPSKPLEPFIPRGQRKWGPFRISPPPRRGRT
jgi:hypothetical protein